MERVKILLVDDETDTLDAMRMGLENNQCYTIFTSGSRKQAINIIKEQTPDVVVTDLKLSDGSGLDIISFVNEYYPGIALIVVTAYGTIDSAVQAVRGGAYEYLQKPIRMNDLKRALARISENIRLRIENEELKRQLGNAKDLPTMIGASKQHKKIMEFIKQVAPAQSNVLVYGESGTGKELVVDTIEYYSTRHGNAFIKINCGAIPENLLESELFGYEKGAFTGAQNQKKGKIEMADHGTLFLDEIGELPKTMQVKLLRVLQNGQFERLGSTTTLKTDVRIITATNANLTNMVEQGAFRQDLFYRLNVISIQVPALRDRLEDLPLLVQFFIDKFNRINNKNIEGVHPDVIKAMNGYSWPGNIRELENMIERAVVLSNHNQLNLVHFPALVANFENQKYLPQDTGLSLAETEKIIIERTLRLHNNDKNKTAMTLQIGLATLYRKMKEYQIK